jgi:hypothetical protein
MKKLSVIRFKPKPECFDQFLGAVKHKLLVVGKRGKGCPNGSVGSV